MLAAAAIATTVGNGGNMATGMATATLANQTQNQLAFSRQYEAEADRVGIETLSKANLNPNSLGDFFFHMQKLTNQYGRNVPEWLVSHPVGAQRIASAKETAARFKGQSVDEKTEFGLVQARLKVLLSHNLMETQYQHANHNNLIGRYAYAVSLNQNGQLAEAKQVLSELLSQQPNQPIFTANYADILLRLRDDQQALALLAASHQANPNYLPVKLLYAQTLLNTNQASKALGILKSVKVPEFENAEYKRLLANAYADSGNMAEARRIMEQNVASSHGLTEKSRN